MPFNDYQCMRIVTLWTECDGKLSWSKMERTLSEEGIITTRQTIKNTINRWLKTGLVIDMPRTGAPKKVPLTHYRCIDEAMSTNDELTATDLKDILSKNLGKRRPSTIQEPLLGFAMSLDGHFQQQGIAKQFGMQTEKEEWSGVKSAWMTRKPLMMSSSQMNLLFSWSVTEENASGRKRHQGSLNTDTSTHQKFMSGPEFPKKVQPRSSCLVAS